MSRILSALVLLAVVVAIVWALPAVWTLALALVALSVAVSEYLRLARAVGAHPQAALAWGSALLACLALWSGGPPLAVTVIAAGVATGVWLVGRGRPDGSVLADAAVTLFPIVYLGVPLGSLVALRQSHGPPAVLGLLAVVMASDTLQYYVGRALGRRKLAPAVSPGKTVEGALAGLAAGLVTLPVIGAWVLPSSPVWALALLGGGLALAGIAGDLFESLLKRSAGLKDSSGLIPGHGGLLDRIDALLFAAPVFYLYVELGGF